jgi:hypothetical protein
MSKNWEYKSKNQGRYKYRSDVPKQEKTPMYRLPVTSLEFAFGLPVMSLEVQRQTCNYRHHFFFMLGHARPILLAALVKTNGEKEPEV